MEWKKVFILLFLILWSGIFLSKKIDLITADLGRHITNGKVLVEAPFAEKLALLKTNFFSYTMPEAPFVNHHWASGIIFYFVHEISGFIGLSFFHILISIAAILLFWNMARSLSNFYIASIITIVLAPLLASRAEVRPEAFGYLLSGIFLNLLFFRKWLWLIPPLMMLWINLHISFIFGFLILGSFCLADFRRFWKVALASLILSLINPFGYKLLIYPFLIFQNYGYRIVENQSIAFLENIGFHANKHFALFKITAGAAAVSVLTLLYKRIKIPLAITLPTVATAVLAYFGIRHFPIFGLFALVFLSYSVYELLVPGLSQDILTAIVAIALVISISLNLTHISNTGWGLMPGTLEAMRFIDNSGIKGPIFNNYDIGGYLIYAAYPREHVFVDNRPEAYTKKFFEEIYIKAQEDDLAWQKLNEEYKFSTVVFSHRDYTPWGQEFLASRLEDKKWEKVFQDNYIIIFNKRQETFRPRGGL